MQDLRLGPIAFPEHRQPQQGLGVDRPSDLQRPSRAQPVRRPGKDSFAVGWHLSKRPRPYRKALLMSAAEKIV